MKENNERFALKRNPNGRNWDIVDTDTDEVVEGGFFSRGIAYEALDDYCENGLIQK